MLRAIRRRRRLSMTALIDVIFLLLLFFMLSSTFSRFAEVELAAAGTGTPLAASDKPALFLQLGPEWLTLNGTSQQLDTLTLPDGPNRLLVALKPGVSAQRLTDLLVALRRFGGVECTGSPSG